MNHPSPRGLLVAAALFIGSLLAPSLAWALNVCEQQMIQASRRHDVPLSVLYAVGMTETGHKGSLQPYAINVEGRPYFGSSAPDAIAHVESAKRGGARLIDIGCMQINQKYHGQKFSSLQEMFDPARNVEYAAVFLTELRKREGDWTLAVARYHAGPDKNIAQKQYVCQVITNMVASGFGNWTPGARSFCA